MTGDLDPAGEGDCEARLTERLAADLSPAFPGARGFTRRNLQYMRTLAGAWPAEFAQQPAAQLPWSHQLTAKAIIKQVSPKPEER